MERKCSTWLTNWRSLLYSSMRLSWLQFESSSMAFLQLISFWMSRSQCFKERWLSICRLRRPIVCGTHSVIRLKLQFVLFLTSAKEQSFFQCWAIGLKSKFLYLIAIICVFRRIFQLLEKHAVMPNMNDIALPFEKLKLLKDLSKWCRFLLFISASQLKVNKLS